MLIILPGSLDVHLELSFDLGHFSRCQPPCSGSLIPRFCFVIFFSRCHFPLSRPPHYPVHVNLKSAHMRFVLYSPKSMSSPRARACRLKNALFQSYHSQSYHSQLIHFVCKFSAMMTAGRVSVTARLAEVAQQAAAP